MNRWLCIGGINTSLFFENNGYRIQINQGKKNRRDLGFACQMKNYLGQKRGEGGGEFSLNWMNQFPFDNSVVASRVATPPHLHTTINRSSD